MALLTGAQSVPDRMLGCWQRRYIRFANGGEDTSTRVIWLQTASGMADMRIAATRPDLRRRTSLDECNNEELLALADQDCSCGITRLDGSATPWPTATWENADFGYALQPVSLYPEPGWFDWREDGHCMMEWAPSGAYEEDWRLLPGSRGDALHLVHRGLAATENLFIAGNHLVYARNRTAAVPEPRPLRELIAARLRDRNLVRALLDFEMSYAARVSEGSYRIALSSLPWKEGTDVDTGWIPNLKDSAGKTWTTVSAWKE